MLHCVICIDENTQVCTASIVFRRYSPNQKLSMVYIAGDDASPSVLRMILICYNHVLNLISGRPFRGPLVPSQTRCFEGAARSFRGPGPLGPFVIRPLARSSRSTRRELSFRYGRPRLPTVSPPAPVLGRQWRNDLVHILLGRQNTDIRCWWRSSIYHGTITCRLQRTTAWAAPP